MEYRIIIGVAAALIFLKMLVVKLCWNWEQIWIYHGLLKMITAYHVYGLCITTGTATTANKAYIAINRSIYHYEVWMLMTI